MLSAPPRQSWITTFEPRLAAGISGLPAAAHAVDAVSGILRRPAVLSRLSNTVGVVAPGWHRARHDRHALLGWARLLDQISVGARGRSCAATVLAASPRAAAQLDAAR